MRKIVNLLASACAVAACLLFSARVQAQTSLEKPSLRTATQISPYYFGPNAFAVPDMLDGTTQRDLRIELQGNHFLGFKKDHTTDATLRLRIPLFTERVNLTLWMPIMEWYRNTDARIAECRLSELAQTDPRVRKGSLSGDVYVSTDIHVLTQKKYRPDLAIRAAMKTASGGDYYYARYYDSPGYFFDATLGKSWTLGRRGAHDLRAAASVGFLCWQTGNGRQDDATMYGLLLRWRAKDFSLTQTLRGYSGWEHNCSINGDLAKDQPMVLKTQLGYRIKRWEILAAYQYGAKDYPFHQFQLGVAYDVKVKLKGH